MEKLDIAQSARSQAEAAYTPGSLQEMVADFIQANEPAHRLTVVQAFEEATAGRWAHIPATGTEWISEAGYSGPQVVTVDVSQPFGGRIADRYAFGEEEAYRNMLLASGEPFAVDDGAGSLILWQSVSNGTDRWPLYRRFQLPFEPVPEERPPVDYILLPNLTIPSIPQAA